MEKILGLDLGSHSIGWAIRDIAERENQIIDKGVLTFQKGVGEEKGIEIPLVKPRTEARGKRRNYQAEKYRKWALLEFLIEKNMCPLTKSELDEWRKYKKGVGRIYPQSQTFINWLRYDFNGDGKPDFEQYGLSKHENHYIFRVLAISEEPKHKNMFTDNPEILGRVFYHLVQRRGFRGRDDEEAKTIMEGSKESGAIGANFVKPYIEKYKTLGAALYYLQKETNTRIRKRFNLRTDFEFELKEICGVQNLDEDSYKRLWKAIIWQRPLRSQKGLVGICIYEKNKPRCPVSHPLYEEYRTWAFINNLKIILPDGVNREKYIREKIYPLFFNASKDFKIEKIIKSLDKIGGKLESRFKPDTKAVSCYLQYNFSKLLGENWKDNYGWQEILNNEIKKCKYDFEDIWHVLFTFDSKDKLKEFALNKIGLDQEKAVKFSNIKLQQCYSTLSLAAIKKILPYLKKGFIYSQAVYLANMPKVIGVKKLTDEISNEFSDNFKLIKKSHDFENRNIEVVNSLISNHLNSVEVDYEKTFIEVFGSKTWLEKLTEEQRNKAYEFVEKHFNEFLNKPNKTKSEGLFLKTGRLHDKIFDLMKSKFSLLEESKKYLWHPSEQETYKEAIYNNDGIKILGDPQPLKRGFKNPMALKTLYQLRKLINYLLHVGKIDEDTRIVIEIARELNDANRRKAIEKYQHDREKENEEFKIKIREIVDEYNLNIDVNDKTFINKYRLWVEQSQQCIYTGKTINCTELFDGSIYDIEHTIPASMSFDNELKNLTIADKNYNVNIKKNKIPFDLPNYDDNVNIDGVEFTAIKPRLKFIEDKVEHYEKLFEEWKTKSKIASNKESKDYCMQKKHIAGYELEYWKKKFATFTCQEYKAGWRNSQLKDTQIVTKFALPYMKTVFRKVDVQKGSVTAAFREIYSIQEREEEKNREKHSHHAIDAAVLTLIPPASIRDKILLKYNEEKEKNFYNVYKEIPNKWRNYDPKIIQEIENEVLINYQAKHRTLTDTYKNVRKRGKQQFVKEQLASGKWQYKMDARSEKIPLVAKGDTVRGQLHKESFFGAIELNKEKWLVERYPISTFENINDCKHIVDDKIRDIVKTTLQKRIDNGQTFDKAKIEPIYFPNGKEVIKKVRCKVAAGRGHLTVEKALLINKHSLLSKHVYKHYAYAQNKENTLCLYYEAKKNEKIERAYRIVGLLELAQLKINNIEKIKEENYYKTIKIGRGINQLEATLFYILKVGTKVIFYKDKLEEIKELSLKELYRRIFRIYKFNETGAPLVYLHNHIEARPNAILGDGDTVFNSNKYQYRLKLVANNFVCAIEGEHFKVMPDGEIKWLF